MNKENQTISLGSVSIGEGKPCLIVPEGGDNHRGSLAAAKEIAHSAKEAGASIIKFQLHLPEEEMVKKGMEETSSSMFKNWGSLYGFIEKNLLKPDEHAQLMEYCKTIGIQYFCTPFSLKAAGLLRDMGVSAFKIGSGETEDMPFIEEAAKMSKPMVISTGMSTWEEIGLTVDVMKKSGTSFSLAHCISAYPPKKTSQLHLGVIREMRNRFGVPVGLSDHTPPEGVEDSSGKKISQEETIWGAIGAGAAFVEKHFTLDRNAPDADSNFSLDSKALKNLIQTVRAAEEAFDKERAVFDQEKPVWIWAKRSVVAVRDIAAGEMLNRSMITSKRPGTGIRSKEYHKIIGKKTKRSIPAGSIIQWEDIEI